MIINTDVAKIVVEIDDNEYELADRTIELMKKLVKIEEDSVASGRLEPEKQLDQLQLLMGKEAVRKVFPKGQKENADRLNAIYYGVIQAFDTNAARVRAESAQARREELNAVTEPLKPLAEVLAAMKNNGEVKKKG